MYIIVVGRAKMKPCTKLELSSFTGFGYILEEGYAKSYRGHVTDGTPLSEMLYFILVVRAKAKLSNLKLI